MIQYNSINSFKEIHYNGHNIKEVHSSLGKVWPIVPSGPKWIATYSDSHTESAECNATSSIIQNEITLTDLVAVEIGQCVTSIGIGGFFNCSTLSSVTIPNSVTSIGISAFFGCSGLTSVTIPSGVTSIGNYAFSNCDSLSSITINAVTPPPLGDYVFYSETDYPIYVPCQSIDAYKSAWSQYASRIQCIPPFNGKFYAEYSDNTSYSAACDSNTTLTDAITRAHSTPYTAMTKAIVGDCITTVGYNSFIGCTSLTSCTIGSGATSINATTFQNCYSLPNITIPSGITSIGQQAFSYCSGLTSVTIEALTPPTLGDYVFFFTNDCPIYVPAQSVNAYKTASGWSTYSSRIQAIT